MAAIGIISPIRKKYANTKGKNLGSSLTEIGRTRYPDSHHIVMIHREPSGRYLTGLDLDASYLKKLSNDEREIEVERIKQWLSYIKQSTDLDLSDPNCSYYKDMMKYFGKDDGHMFGLQPVKMIDGDNKFSLDNPFELIQFCYLRVHPLVAPSFRAYELGQCLPECQYFVNDEEFELKYQYNQKVKMNKAISLWDSLNPVERKKRAKLMGLTVYADTADEKVYNMGDEFLRNNTVKGQNNLSIFEKVNSQKQETINIRYLIRQAIDYNVYRKIGESIYEGDVEKAKTEEELVKYLSVAKNQSDYELLQEKVRQRQAQELV